MKILHVGDINGSPGRQAFMKIAAPMKARGEVDVIVANGENAAAGRGITPALAGELLEAGADVITLGDHAWDQKELIPFIDLEPRLIRPLNFAPGAPGKGYVRIETPGGSLTVVQVIGRVFMDPYDCPFRAFDQLMKLHPELGPRILVEIHAEATSEKIAFGRYVEGRVSAVAGTHTHVQTSDDAILSKGTSYITDLGMTGPKNSIIGREVEPVLRKFVTGMPVKMDMAKEDVALEGVVVEIDGSGRARAIQRIRTFL
ncbi:MAG TPA: TIGR00282 family metallophosphoesterase [Kiritimatiellia bacterium]|nr:TIGR00282 family metallophosphoesterase [Kiritimatiellia bacterium]HMO99928.1 TIGR00282 family metallophosphoesterase [Kiritimatiellia bacterium]HMP97939.1 TIGR00282 family metallophosphoesterase [Kiritimatiellia bacterium]